MIKRPGVVIALWLLGFVNYLDRVAISFAGPSIMKSLTLSPAAFGVVLSSFGIGYMLAQIPGGLLGDRWGARAMLVIGPIFWAIFTGATGLVSTLLGFVLARVCFGLSEGLSTPAVYMAVGNSFDLRGRPRAMGIVATSNAVAPAVGGALVGALVVAYGWRAMFLIMMAPALLVAVVSYVLIPIHRRAPSVAGEAESEANPSFRRLLGRPSLWLLSLASLCWNIPYWGYIGWMPSYLALARHIDLKTVGPLASVPYLFGFVGMLIGGWLGGGLLNRHCPQLLVGCFVGAGLSLALAYQADDLAMSLAGLSGAAFFLFGTNGPTAKVVLELAPERLRGAYIGIYNTAGQFGGLLAPAAIGFLVSATGAFASGFGLMIAAWAAASVLLLVLASLKPPMSLVAPVAA